MITQKKITAYLCIFAFILSSLFVYQFYSMQKTKNNYNSLKKSVIELMNINLNLDNFIANRYQFVNFDTLIKENQNLQNVFKRANTCIKNGYFHSSGQELAKIEKLFGLKISNIERYKSRLVVNLNSFYSLFDISKSLQNSSLEYQTIQKTDRVLFFLVQYLLNIVQNKNTIKDYMDDIEKQNLSLKNEDISFFILHMKNILNNDLYLKKLEKEITSAKISTHLNHLNDVLTNQFNSKLYALNVIGFILLLSFIVIIVIILFLHNKTNLIKKKLMLFQKAVDNSQTCVIVTDKDRNITYTNKSFLQLSGYAKDEILNKNINILKSDLNPKETYENLYSHLQKGIKWEGELINTKKNGDHYYSKLSILPIFVDNELKNFLALKFDISEYIRQREELKLFEVVFTNMRDGVLVCDENQNIIALNHAYETIMQVTLAQILGKKARIFSEDFHDKLMQENILYSLKNKGFFQGKIIQKDAADRNIYLWANISTIKDKNDKINKYIIVYTSLEELIKSQQRAEYLSYHDSLTGLANRIKLNNDIDSKIQRIKDSHEEFYLLFVDLDRFKVINDNLGHKVGDKILKIVANKIKNLLSQKDLVGRFGGDEFIVLLDANKRQRADLLAKQIIQATNDYMNVNSQILNTGASIGIVQYPKDGEDFISLVKNAEIAMYNAKSKGKNTFSYYDTELSKEIQYKLDIENALSAAINNKEFFLNYQPQYNLKTKKVTSFEALVRWRHKELGLIRPDIFIQIAEDNKKIIPLGELIFDMACRDFVAFKQLDPNLQYIAINVSSIQFSDENFIPNICKILEKYSLKAHEVEIEVTERYVMEFNQHNLNIILKLRDLGFRFSIDDFGTGFSSLNYLTKLPMDIIKIDKSFVDGIPHDNGHMQISKTIVTLANNLEAKVVAEGIEHEEQEKYLISINCQLGQGFLFSKPLSFEDTIDFINKHSLKK